MTFKKFPLDKAQWYVEALRRKPEFIQECDKAVRFFLDHDRPDVLEALKSRPEQFGNDPYTSPWALRSFMDYSPQAEALGKRWGLMEAWHYACPDFPEPRSWCPVRPQLYPPNDTNLLEDELLLEIDLRASKEDLLKWFAYQVDRFKFRKGRGPDSDSDLPFKAYDLYRKLKNFWHVTQSLFPEVADKDFNYDLEAKRRYEQVKAAYRKAEKWIEEITPA